MSGATDARTVTRVKRIIIYLLIAASASFACLFAIEAVKPDSIAVISNNFEYKKSPSAVNADNGGVTRIHMEKDADGFSATTWTGDIDLIISNASLVSSEQVVKEYSDKAAYFDKHLMEGYEASGDKWVGLLLVLKIENVDAKPTDISQAGEKVFRIDEFEVWPRGHVGGIIYFDGTVSDMASKDAYCFSLKNGQTREVEVIYSIPEPLLCNEYALGVGLDDYGLPKVEIPLKIEDRR